MPKIFISYRRHDSAEVTKRLHGRLAHEFDSFYDIDSIPPGVDFRKRLSGAVEQSDALLAVIGSGSWLNATYRDGPKQGERRLDDSDDYVRIEIEAALTLGVPVIPVLVDGASMPTGEALPSGLEELACRNAAEVRLGPEFNVHVDRLIHNLKDLIKDQQELWDGLERARDVAEKDPEWALSRVRKVLERIAREVYERRINEPAGTRSLEKIVERLVQEWYLPDKFDLGGLLVKPGVGDRRKGITSADAERALAQLTEILEWYTEVEQPDGVGQLPAPKRLPESTKSKSPERSPAARIAIVPKGLRSFDSNDVDFFLELLPGPRDKGGLPDSICFWKLRVEATDELTFTVGVIYGPSGCGKSSLMKAGLIPRLSKQVISIYVEATADDTEVRLLKGLRKHCPRLRADLDLMETMTALRLGKGLAQHQKVLIVLDQFEQWLHAKRQEENTELVKALRQCDGEHVQCIVMVRDDFGMATTRFMDSLDIPIIQGQNFATVDLFDTGHAKTVLTKFGQAFGKLPAQLSTLSSDENDFLSSVAAGLAHDGRVISVRLALFADMVKSKPWTPATLKEVGGTEGVGVTFLEETFSAAGANPSHRLHQKAARAVLKALLPEQGTDIKGNMCSRLELLQSSGYINRPPDFETLIRILDNDVRLITPTDPEGVDSDYPNTNVQTDHRYYQLTHDYLVHSLREWLTRKQKETRRGRAELQLADRSALWKEKRENRHLPSLWEFLNIRLLTDNSRWTAPQRKMMGKAGRFHGIRSGIAAAVLIALTLSGLVISRQFEEKRRADYADGLVLQLVAADIGEVPGIVRKLNSYRRCADPSLREQDAKAEHGSNKKINVALALLPVDESKIAELRDDLLLVSPRQFVVIRDALLLHKDGVVEPLWSMALEPKREIQQRFQAACALATYAPDDKRWSQINIIVASRLVTLESNAPRGGRETLTLPKTKLIEPLALIFRDTKRKEQSRIYATETLADYAADRPAELFDLLADAEQFQFPVVFEKLARQKDKAVAMATEELARKPPARANEDEKEFLAKRQANAAVALLRFGAPDKVWPLLKFTPDPRVRSYIIHWIGPLEGDPKTITQRFDAEPDVTIRRAIVIMLGEFSEMQLSSAQRQHLIEKLLDVYENEPDAGLHGAVEWLLRKWGQGKRLEVVIEKLKSDDEQLQSRKASNKRQWYVNTQKQTFVIVDAREKWFWMGSPESEPDRYPEESQHRRRIGRRFAIATTEVTKEQFGRFQAARPEIAKSDTDQWVKTDDSPQVKMTWYEAAAYCDWLSEREGIPKEQWCYERNKQGKYAAGMKAKENHLKLMGYRLPTEAEWEYACRAETVTSRYYGLSERLLPQYAWYAKNGQNRIWPTGSLEPNDLGLFDMLGNAVEWCFDLYMKYPKRTDEDFDDIPTTQPVETVDRRVLRGGGFYTLPVIIRSAHRYNNQPGDRNISFGFRPARTYP